MSNDRSEHSYDLSGAHAITERLRSRRKRLGTQRPPAPASDGFVRFSLGRINYGAPPEDPNRVGGQEQADIVEGIPWSPEMMGSEGWARMLDWCLKALEAEGAFIVDDRGLMIGSRGAMNVQTMEEVGARLLIAFEQADLMCGDKGMSQSMSIEMTEGWLVGMRIPLSGSEKLTFGVVTWRPLSRAARRKIEAAFAKKAMGL
jgi:hypothetical protein